MIADHAKRSRGFSLIEALIALLVLSIGMLGAAAMQLNALQSAHIAYQRSIATLAAQDAQERLWAGMSRSNGTLTCLSGSGISALEADWHTVWSGYLPGFSNHSGVSPADNCVFEITVGWLDGRADGGKEEFIYRVRLPGRASP